MKIIFIGQFVSNEESLTDLNYSQAANLYQLKFLKLIKPALAISIIPLFINKNKFFSYSKYDVNFINKYTLKIRPNFLNNLCRVFVNSFHSLKLIMKSDIKPVWFYNIDITTVFIALFLMLFTSKKVNILIADYSFSPFNLLSILVSIVIKMSSAAIVWNSLIIHKNRVVLPDILDSSVIKLNKSDTIQPKILFSGSLGKTTGFEHALSFFSKFNNYQFIITGKPYHYAENEFQLLIDKYVVPSNNITYHGLVSLDEYYDIIDTVDIALSFRDPDDPQHDGNFPSKILEYLSFSKFVLSTKKYNDIDPNLYFYTSYDFDSINETLIKILKLSKIEVSKKKELIYDILIRDHSEKALINAVKLLSK